MKNQAYRMALLYDFYGELLTEHQKRVYQEVVFNDLSLSEAAEQEHISRQGVHDLIRRCDRILAGYEEKLHLVEKFASTKRLAAEIQTALDDYEVRKDPELLSRARRAARQITQIESR